MSEHILALLASIAAVKAAPGILDLLSTEDKIDGAHNVKEVANECAVHQDQNCCSVVKAGSSQHKDWSEKYSHLKEQSGNDYLECEASGRSAGGCSAKATPFCCNTSGSFLALVDCTPITLNIPIASKFDE